MSLDKPAADALLGEIAARLPRIGWPISPDQAAARAEEIVRCLLSGRPPADLFVHLAAIATIGAAACQARDAAQRKTLAKPGA